MQTVYIAIGTNQGDLASHIQTAIDLIKEIPDTDIEAQSAFRDYAPEDAASGQPDYRNGVIRVRTDLGPLDLLHKLQVIERRMGRSSKGDGANRVIDLDILSFGQEVIIQGKTLTVPHPRMTGRLFVLEPLAELDPGWKHPRSGRTAAELLEELKSSSSVTASAAGPQGPSPAGDVHESSSSSPEAPSGA